MVVWTHQAECQLLKESNNAISCPDKTILNEESRLAMNLHVRLTVLQTNIALWNSGVDARLNLVNAQRDETYVEFVTASMDAIGNALYDITCRNDGSSTLGSGTYLTQCSNLAFPNNGAFDDVFERRVNTGADLVALLTIGSGGVAWRPSSPTADLMFAVSGWKTGASGFVVGHELGHNFVRQLNNLCVCVCFTYDHLSKILRN